MTGIETNFQLKSWKSRLLQIAAEIQANVEQIPESPRQDRMIEATVMLGRVVDKLDFARAIPGDKEETPLLLKLSVQGHRQRMEQKRCQHVGGEVPLKTEKAHSANVSPFLRPSANANQPNQSGE